MYLELLKTYQEIQIDQIIPNDIVVFSTDLPYDRCPLFTIIEVNDEVEYILEYTFKGIVYPEIGTTRIKSSLRELKRSIQSIQQSSNGKVRILRKAI